MAATCIVWVSCENCRSIQNWIRKHAGTLQNAPMRNTWPHHMSKKGHEKHIGEIFYDNEKITDVRHVI